MVEMFKVKDTEHYDYPQLSIFNDAVGNSRFENLIKKNTYKPDRNTVLYVHVPFCKSFCVFCNYYKVKPEKKVVDQFVEAIIVELKHYSETLPSEVKIISAVHFGGGTPSSIGITGLQRIVDTINKSFTVKEDCLFSTEGHIRELQDAEFIKELKRIGFKRVSFGVQSFTPEIRKKYGLLPVRQVEQTLHNLAEYGFDDYNIDLMYNFPEQHFEEIIGDINRAFEYGVNCIDLYSLNVFPNTRMEGFMKKNETYKKYIDIDQRYAYTGIYNYLQNDKECNMVMSNTISRKSDRPNLYLETHLGANKLDGGRIIGVGPSSRGYLDGFIYKNYVNVNDYVKAIHESRHARHLEHELTECERQNRLFVMFPNFTYLRIEDAVFNEFTRKTMDLLLENKYVYEDDKKFYIKPVDCYWAGNISGMFYSGEQKEKMIKTLLLNRKNKLNMYNQDKMQIVEREDI
ncbi:MAG: coproporphyrinogen-III oxidase family protein [Velocimicrobium sp.]